MTESKDRLQAAIAEYDGPVDAWTHNKRELEKGGVGKDLMVSNCNGNRAISKNAAATYARVFGHTPGWYLYDEKATEQVPKALSPAEDAEARLRAALIAFGVDRKSVRRAVAAIRAGFVRAEDRREQNPQDGPLEPASLRRG